MPSPEPRWGVWLHAIHPVSELAQLAAAAEAMGAAAVLVADEGNDRDVFVTLAAIAQLTTRALLFAAVTNPHSRHPLALAAAFASLAELAPGRIIAGLGTGGSRVFGPMGLSPARPYTALRESVDALEALWRGETVSLEGEFALRSARLDWASEPIPIALAGRGPRVERLAAERADWVLLAGRAVDTVSSLITGLRDMGRVARGRAPAVAWNPVAAWNDTMRDELRAHLAYMAVDMPPSERAVLGFTDDFIDELRRVVNTSGSEAAAALIPDQVLERHAISGSRREVVARLGGLLTVMRPELVVFDVPEYSVAAIESIASLAMEAGAGAVQNVEAH